MNLKPFYTPELTIFIYYPCPLGSDIYWDYWLLFLLHFDVTKNDLLSISKNFQKETYSAWKCCSMEVTKCTPFDVWLCVSQFLQRKSHPVLLFVNVIFNKQKPFISCLFHIWIVTYAMRLFPHRLNTYKNINNHTCFMFFLCGWMPNYPM